MGNNTLLAVENLWVERPGTEVLRGVNLTVGYGEVHALLGLNGSGKTSLALTLMGAGGYKPARGRILFEGADRGGYGGGGALAGGLPGPHGQPRPLRR